MLITGWPAEEVASVLGVERGDSEVMWESFRPIMEYLGIRYSWRREDEGVRMSFERERA